MKHPYQDVWRDGQLLQKGRRSCGPRYTQIMGMFDKLDMRPQSLIDVGSFEGYFSIRFSEDGYKVTALDMRSEHAEPIRASGAAFLQHDLLRGWPGLQADVILCLSVLHHLDNWQQVYDSMRASCSWLIVETPLPNETKSRVMRRAINRTQPLHDRINTDSVMHTRGVKAISEPRAFRPIHAVPGT